MHLSRPAWYCIRSHPKHEHIAAANLRHLPGVEVFNPQMRFVRSTRRGRVWSTEAPFPNYLFAKFVLQTGLEKVRYTPSVSSVLKFGDRVPAIPDQVIEELRQSLETDEPRVFTDAPFEGDEVEISSGPFQGDHAIVTRVLPGRERVRVLVDILGRATPTELNLASVFFEKRPTATFLPADAAPVLRGCHSPRRKQPPNAG